jgi:hypothetical protein
MRGTRLRNLAYFHKRGSGDGFILSAAFDIPRARSAMNGTLRLLAVALAAVALLSLDLRAISTEMSFFGGPAGLPLTPLGQGLRFECIRPLFLHCSERDCTIAGGGFEPPTFGL